ncbi:MAG: HD domain-containing phosphohydrolase [Thermodesulfobacteriota bacterium]|jgi:putative two-component system response regulator
MFRKHHKYYDGSGYQDGLTGEVIPLEVRIISVPDAFDAMTSLRTYPKAKPLENVFAEMEKGRANNLIQRY